MSYSQDLSRCSIDGPHTKEKEILLSSIEKLKNLQENAELPILNLPYEMGDLEALAPIADHLKSFDHVVVIGTGGSSLGGKSLIALKNQELTHPKPYVHFLENVDPHTMRVSLKNLPLEKTAFIIISKSGSTTETLAQFLLVLDAMKKVVPDDKLKEHFICITEPKESTLTKLANAYHMILLSHDPLVGGRFSVLSLVGLLPAMVAGMDVVAVRKGARDVLNQTLKAKKAEDSGPAMGALTQIMHSESKFHNSVMMPYCDRLEHFSSWYCQLWAESIGKEGKGTTPVRALGTVDQHSQLQLYTDGPKDKLFTVIKVQEQQDSELPLGFNAADLERDDSLSYLAGNTLGDVMKAEETATIQTLTENKCPVRVMDIAKLDEEAMGGLYMHFMLETIFAADLLDVNAFDQPGVEQSKILTKQYLNDKAAV